MRVPLLHNSYISWLVVVAFLFVQEGLGLQQKIMFRLGSRATPLVKRRTASFHESSTRLLMATSQKTKKRRIPSGSGKTFRADRVLSNRGWGSRSECFDLLRQRRVSEEVDGILHPLLGPSEKLYMDADLWVDETKEVPKPAPLLRVFHKPKWMLSVMNDNKGRSNLSQLKDTAIAKMHPVGRLDYDTSGLLLFSSDGKLTQTLLHPNHHISKEYVAVVPGVVNEAELRETLAQGVETSMGSFPAQLMEASRLPDDQVAPLISDILSNLPDEYDMDHLEEKGHLFFKNATELSRLRVVVEEGKHRMVRRILANSGYPVMVLQREKLGEIQLGNLQPGEFRDLNPSEEKWARSLLKPARGSRSKRGSKKKKE